MIDIREHPANDVIRRRNKREIAAGREASQLIKDQHMVMCDGMQVAWLNHHPAKPAGVVMTLAVDDEMLEEISREVERYLGQSVPIGTQEPDEDEPDKDEPEPSKIWTPEGGDDES